MLARTRFAIFFHVMFNFTNKHHLIVPTVDPHSYMYKYIVQCNAVFTLRLVTETGKFRLPIGQLTKLNNLLSEFSSVSHK